MRIKRIKTGIGRRMAELELTEEEFGEMIGQSQSRVNRIKNGKIQPRVILALRMAAALTCPVESLWPDYEVGDE